MSSVFVGNLSDNSTYDDIDYLFGKFGRIRKITLKHGYGFIEYDDYRDAEDAVYELNGEKLQGERITVEHSRGPNSGGGRRGGGGGRFDFGGRGGGRGGFGGYGRRAPVWLEKYGPPTRTGYRLIVENLSSRVSWQDLKDYMRQAGDVTYADAHRGRKNEGTVEFGSYHDMKTALDKLDDTEINGRKIKLIEDKTARPPRKSHSRSRSRSRSPLSRSRSRSRSEEKGRSRSRSGSRRSRSRTRSRSPSRGSRSRSRDSRSRSRSPDENHQV